ncbi:MAG: adenylosuccinate lyase [Chitinophagaceae bacterium]|nr:MAG: adenylosuccinate lyase [Bacteroidetes bacterium OLB11]MCC6448351.1 adenylosuccinate lyase [Chitinophagaceae bacterium]HMN33744.1 adenylosuccinate lyase [Chitinophagaceae bacterium]
MQPLSPLNAISPIDGRYRNQLEELAPYFSEYALIKYRVQVEVEYFIALSTLGLFSLSEKNKTVLRNIVKNFSEENASQVKAIEKITNHDVKAVEYFIKEKLSNLKLDAIAEWVHFGLTSQDINNTSIPLLWKDAIQKLYLPNIQKMIAKLKAMAKEWNNIPMLARTHGQPASPTRLGKEILVFVERIENQIQILNQIPFSAKFGGATGNLNAHWVAYPDIKWKQFVNQFVNKTLGLKRMQYTTQIEHYDHLAAQFDTLKRINTIWIDFSRDIWTYISMEYFKQRVNKNEVGSSAMPHKVNPIDFENAEGNLGVANALYEHLAAKLPVSRLQRDLTDSTVLRNIGIPFAHSILAFHSLNKGMNKLIINKQKLNEDLEANWSVVAEAIQTVLRREKFPKPYEALKELTRGAVHMNKQLIYQFIDSLNVSEKVKLELKKITPQNYTGKV